MTRVPLLVHAKRVLGAGLVAALGAVPLLAAAPHPPAFPEPSRSSRPPAPVGRSLEFAVRGQAGRSHQVTVVVGDRQASFLHHGRRPVRYRLRDLGSQPVPGEVVVRVEPAASVSFEPGAVGLRPTEPRLRWHHAGPTMELPPPVAAGGGRRVAEASVDETDTWGLRLLGVPVRAEPRVGARLVGVVTHGDRLRAVCWTTGDRVSNAFREHRVGGYDADVWYRLEHPDGYLPDVRFGRRAHTDRLGLPACDRLAP